jgi:hypothetical protein
MGAGKDRGRRDSAACGVPEAKGTDRLKADRTTENTVCEVVGLLRRSPGEYLTVSDIAHRLGRPEALVAMILLELADAFVLLNDGLRYTYLRDPVVEMDVERFLRRTDGNNAFVQTNVARFRDRYGYR